MGPMSNRINIQPQPGPQTVFAETLADIAIFGGAAGGGNSYSLLLEPLRHINNAKFAATCFRRNSVMIRNQGGLWQESLSLYSYCQGHPREASLEWIFPSGMRLKFAHLEHERTVYDYQGMQSALIMFDELTHFSAGQFFYMLSRLRSASGVRGYVRASCNPDPDSFVASLIQWWLNDEGYPIPERSGVLRWFIRRDDTLHWADTREELLQLFGADELPLSFTFIPSKLEDNKILMENDPSYLANLNALSYVDRMRLKGGNWKVRASAGTVFQRQWFPIVETLPAGWVQVLRFWDRAATKPHSGNPDPDWTRGLKLYKYADGTFIVGDIKSLRDTPGQVENLIKSTASHDGFAVRIMSQKDPGSAGVAEADNFIRMLVGYDVRTMASTKDKLTRAKPVSAQAEAGNIKVLRAPWNEKFFEELENFSGDDVGKDDQVDALSGAFNELSGAYSILDGYKNMAH